MKTKENTNLYCNTPTLLSTAGSVRPEAKQGTQKIIIVTY